MDTFSYETMSKLNNQNQQIQSCGGNKTKWLSVRVLISVYLQLADKAVKREQIIRNLVHVRKLPQKYDYIAPASVPEAGLEVQCKH